jgi:hypothetical protein
MSEDEQIEMDGAILANLNILKGNMNLPAEYVIN